MFKEKQRMGRRLIGMLLGSLVGVILYLVQPVQWKGEALVRIGQFTQSQYFIEPIATVMERLKSRSFIQAVAKRAKRNEVVALLDTEEDAGLTVKPTRNGDSLIITVIGGPAELVHTSIDALVAELLSKHDAILSAYEADILKELSRLDLEQSALSKRLATMLDGQDAAGSSRQAEKKWLATGFGVMAIQHDLEYKLNRSSALRESISSVNIRPTSLIEPISMTERRMFSSLWRACLFGALLGGILSEIWFHWGK